MCAKQSSPSRELFKKEENEVTQRKLDEYSMQHGRASRTVRLSRDQVRKLQERLDFLKDEKEFHDPDSSSNSSRSYVPHQPLITLSSRRKPSCGSGLLRNTREDMSIPGSVFASQPARRRNPDEVRNNSRNLATPSRMKRIAGIEKSEENHCQQYLCLAFKGERELKVETM